MVRKWREGSWKTRGGKGRRKGWGIEGEGGRDVKRERKVRQGMERQEVKKIKRNG